MRLGCNSLVLQAPAWGYGSRSLFYLKCYKRVIYRPLRIKTIAYPTLSKPGRLVFLPSRPRHTSVALPPRPPQVTNSPPWPHGRNFDDFATIVALCRTPNVKGLQTAVSVYLLGSNLNRQCGGLTRPPVSIILPKSTLQQSKDIRFLVFALVPCGKTFVGSIKLLQCKHHNDMAG